MEITLTYNVEVTEIIRTEDNAIFSPQELENHKNMRELELNKRFDDARISHLKQFCMEEHR